MKRCPCGWQGSDTDYHNHNSSWGKIRNDKDDPNQCSTLAICLTFVILFLVFVVLPIVVCYFHM